MKTIEVIITPLGEVQMEAIGFKGTACEKATAELEKSLGVPTSKKKKPEYSAFGTSTNTQKVGGA